MGLRKLERADAPFMLEWMPAEVVENMQTDFSLKTISDCEAFMIRTDTKD